MTAHRFRFLDDEGEAHLVELDRDNVAALFAGDPMPWLDWECSNALNALAYDISRRRPPRPRTRYVQHHL